MLFIGEDFSLQDVHLIFWILGRTLVFSYLRRILEPDYYYVELRLYDYGSILSEKYS